MTSCVIAHDFAGLGKDRHGNNFETGWYEIELNVVNMFCQMVVAV
jgi:hypothetical protein